MELERVRRRSASDAVFEQLAGKLVAGELEEGSALPPERSLTDVLGVNRQAVREALQRLAQAGLIAIRHGEVTRALDYRRSAGLDLLPRLIVNPDGSIDVRVVRSIMEMRAAVGADAARLCARRATPGTVGRLEENARVMAGVDDVEELARLDLSFWDAVVDGADNVAYRLAFNSLRRTYEPVLSAVADSLEVELRDVEGRARLLDAIRVGDETRASSAAATLLARGTAGLTSRLIDERGEGDGDES